MHKVTSPRKTKNYSSVGAFKTVVQNRLINSPNDSSLIHMEFPQEDNASLNIIYCDISLINGPPNKKKRYIITVEEA